MEECKPYAVLEWSMGPKPPEPYAISTMLGGTEGIWGLTPGLRNSELNPLEELFRKPK